MARRDDVIVIDGFEDAARILEKLGDDVRKRAYRKPLQLAGEPLKQDIEERAYKAPGGPTYPQKGHFADHIKISTSIRKGGDLLVKAGVEKGYAWANFVEYGPPREKSNMPRPFMRPAYESSKVREETRRVFGEALWDEIEKELMKLGIR